MKKMFVLNKSLSLMLLTALLLSPGMMASVQQQEHDHNQPAANTPPAEVTIKAPSIPDVVVVDQDNRKVHFYRDLVQGKTVAVNFIFTTCTTICPPLTANFAKIQKTMLQRGEKNLRLISVSVDPENDTPERLKKYAALFGARPGWTFVTGSRADMEQIWKAFNIILPSKQDHPPTIAVGNDVTHVWNYVSGLSSAGKIVAVIDSAMQNEENRKMGMSSNEKEHSSGSQ